MAGRRKKPLPIGEFDAEVLDLDHDGRGVARVNGKVTFIVGALPGEHVRYRLTRVTRDIDEAVMVSVEQASPERVPAPCPHFGVCGGCALQHLAPEAQIAFKQKQLLDALRRIGGLTPEAVAEPVRGPIWGYRRRARLGVKHVPKKGGMLVGFRERDSALVTALTRCDVLDERIGLRVQALSDVLAGLSIAARIPQIEVAGGEHMAIVIRVLSPPTDADRAALITFAIEHDFDVYLQPGSPDDLEPLTSARPLRYAPDDSPLRLEFLPSDFIQINGALSQRMVRQALDWLALSPGESVLELFAGLGNFTAPLAAAGALVTAVEGEAGLVARGRDNLARNGLQARFLRADLFKPDPHAEWLRGRYDAALLDPPRSGAAEIIPHVAAVKPRRIVYVSCHPATLARDAGELVRTHGYRLRRAGVLDMFPHTAHIESMALFERD